MSKQFTNRSDYIRCISFISLFVLFFLMVISKIALDFEWIIFVLSAFYAIANVSLCSTIIEKKSKHYILRFCLGFIGIELVAFIPLLIITFIKHII